MTHYMSEPSLAQADRCLATEPEAKHCCCQARRETPTVSNDLKSLPVQTGLLRPIDVSSRRESNNRRRFRFVQLLKTFATRSDNARQAQQRAHERTHLIRKFITSRAIFMCRPNFFLRTRFPTLGAGRYHTKQSTVELGYNTKQSTVELGYTTKQSGVELGWMSRPNKAGDF